VAGVLILAVDRQPLLDMLCAAAEITLMMQGGPIAVVRL
jgi:hypothetical protein